MKADGHVHTPFCPHGTKDAFEEYINKATELGFTEISFTEHAPLPSSFTDPTPEQDSAMNAADVEAYISELQQLKKKYRNDIRINIGFEVDFIDGFEEETTAWLNEYGAFIDDSILSVHFLKYKGEYDCIDFSEDTFGQMIEKYGGIDQVYLTYYQTVTKSITANLGWFKPKRIGHITLVHKFQKKFPCRSNYKSNILTILQEVQEKGYQLDYNGAGFIKPLCGEPYPPNWVIQEAVRRNIPLVYGSDAHAVKGLNQGFHSLLNVDILCSPTSS